MRLNDKSHNRILLAKALRTTRFGNGAEKISKCTVIRLLSNEFIFTRTSRILNDLIMIMICYKQNSYWGSPFNSSGPISASEPTAGPGLAPSCHRPSLKSWNTGSILNRIVCT